MITQPLASDAAAFRSHLQGAASPLRREREAGSNLVVFARPTFRELHLTLTLTAGETIDALVKRLAELLQRHHATVVRQFVFGAVAVHDETLRAIHRVLGKVDWPITWVQGGSGCGGVIAGMQIHAMAGAQIQSLVHHNRIVGRVFDDGTAKHCVLGDLGPTNVSASTSEQARETFENMEAALGLAGLAMKDVVRTWVFLDDILSWYDRFNTVRNDFFARNELRPHSFPASTGVGGKNPRGMALIIGAWAIQPHNASAGVSTVSSPMQCSPPAYGSAFSRAVEVFSPHARQLLVSGTASIGPEGQTMYVGDTLRQIELTMEVVDAILQSRGMTFADVTLATAYFRSPTDVPLFAEWCRRHGQTTLPVVPTCCDICRDDLLFEIELDAVSCLP